jgi:hypothetical protein
VFSPAVLVAGRIVGGWRTAPGRPAGDTVIEILPFDDRPGLSEESLAGPVADTARALDLTVTDVRILPAP